MKDALLAFGYLLALAACGGAASDNTAPPEEIAAACKAKCARDVRCKKPDTATCKSLCVAASQQLRRDIVANIKRCAAVVCDPNATADDAAVRRCVFDGISPLDYHFAFADSCQNHFKACQIDISGTSQCDPANAQIVVQNRSSINEFYSCFERECGLVSFCIEEKKYGR